MRQLDQLPKPGTSAQDPEKKQEIPDWSILMPEWEKKRREFGVVNTDSMTTEEKEARRRETLERARKEAYAMPEKKSTPTAADMGIDIEIPTE